MTRPVVLTVNRVGFLGGVERIILNTADAARAAGLAPVLACPQGELADAARDHGFEVNVLGIDRGRKVGSVGGLVRLAGALARARSEVRALVRGRPVALLHVHHPMSAVQAAAAARAAAAPMLVHVHETLPIGLAYRLAMGRTRRLGRLFLGVSEASCAMARSVGVAPDRVRLVHNAVDGRFLEPLEPAGDVVGHGGPKFGLFGVLEPRKGHEGFLRAAAACARELPSASFWIVGALSFGENEAYAARLRTLAHELGIADRVHFTGFRRDVPNLMAAMDCVVLASTGFESLPTVLIEACALGRPVVATDIGGVREIVTDGETGLVVSPNDPVALAVAMRTAASPAGRTLAERARRDAAIRFGPGRFVRDIGSIYTELSGGGVTASSPMGRAE